MILWLQLGLTQPSRLFWTELPPQWLSSGLGSDVLRVLSLNHFIWGAENSICVEFVVSLLVFLSPLSSPILCSLRFKLFFLYCCQICLCFHCDCVSVAAQVLKHLSWKGQNATKVIQYLLYVNLPMLNLLSWCWLAAVTWWHLPLCMASLFLLRHKSGLCLSIGSDVIFLRPFF